MRFQREIMLFAFSFSGAWAWYYLMHNHEDRNAYWGGATGAFIGGVLGNFLVKGM